MSEFQLFLLLGTVVTFGIISYFLDAKYQMQFGAWCNGEVENPFIKNTEKVSEESNNIDSEIKTLKERIATLETIVTEPSYELNKQISRLSQK
ncbi:hypothetical protein [Glaciecola sp. 1036]|uniref:hypothetical protein n=1 Tax=Alteromonadaceae TaxID=72275 RepID=UPI003D02CAA5